MANALTAEESLSHDDVTGDATPSRSPLSTSEGCPSDSLQDGERRSEAQRDAGHVEGGRGVGSDEGPAWEEEEDVGASCEGLESVVKGPPVLDLSCGSCGRELCRRGMAVHLVSDKSVRLFSTDFRPLGVVEAAAQREHGSCRCAVRDVSCVCSAHVGYHVIEPCGFCAGHGHNSQYWLFTGGVASEPRLDANRRHCSWDLQHRGIVDGAGAPLEELAAPGTPASDQDCPICYEDMAEPQVLPCGHVACLRCLTRAVDLRRTCPLCRRVVNCTDLTPLSA